MDLLGKPQPKYPRCSLEYPVSPEEPEYKVPRTSYRGVHRHQSIADEIGVGGLEECFVKSNPPEMLRTTTQLASPEVQFVKVPGPPSDVWTLACTIWTMRTGFPPFTWGGLDPIQHAIWNMEYFLGPLPDPYETAFDKCSDAQKRGVLKIKRNPEVVLYMADGNDPGRRAHPYRFDPQHCVSPISSPAGRPEPPEDEDVKNIPDEMRVKLNREYELDTRPRNRDPKRRIEPVVDIPPSTGGGRGECDCCQPWYLNREVHPYCTTGLNERVPQFNTPFERELAKDWEGLHRDPTPYDPTYDPEHPNWVEYTWRMPDDEIVPLADLMSKALRYDPDERIEASDLLKHPWFQPLHDENGKQEAVAETTSESWRKRLRPRKKS